MSRPLPRALTLWLTIAAVAAGLAYSLSPGGCVVLALLLGVCVWGTKDLTGAERRWAQGVIVVAVGLRLAAIVAIAWHSNPQQESFAALVPDARYVLRRSMWLRNLAVGLPVSPENYFRAFEPEYGVTSINHVLATMHLLFGPSPYAGHLLATLTFFCAVFILFRLARRSYGPAAALAGLGVILFMPSLFVWSISPLKEAPTALTVAVAVAAIVASLRARRAGMRIAAPVVAVMALVAAHGVRPEGMWLAIAGLGLGIGLWLMISRRAFALAAGGAAIIAVAAVVVIPRLHAQALSLLQTAAFRHYLHTVSVGHFYRLLDAEYYPPNGATFNAADVGASSRFLIRAAVRFITAPEPWILRPGFELVVIPQQMAWYVLVVCAAFGVWYGMARDRLVTLLLTGLCVASWLLIGPISGNIGTLVRHRDSLMPWTVWLSAVGAVSLVPAMPARVRRWNSVDVSAAALALLLPIGFGVFWLFHAPMPSVSAIAPSQLAVGQRAVLRGHHLRPFLRVFVVEAGGTFTMADRTSWPPEAKYWLRTIDEAEIEIPALAPGAYDLALVDGVEPLARLPRAFTVLPAAPPDSVVLTVSGRFIGVEPGVAGRLRAQQAPSVEPWMDVVHLEPPIPDRRSISKGGRYVTAIVDGRVAIPAVLRVRCAIEGTECHAGGFAFAADTQAPLLVDGLRLLFAVDHVEGAGATALTPGKSVDVLARFVAQPFVARLIAAGDRDLAAETHPAPVAAQILRIVKAETVNGQTAFDSSSAGTRLTIASPMMLVEALIRVPAGIDGASTYRGHRMAPGAPLEFETDRYAVAGRILTVTPGGARP